MSVISRGYLTEESRSSAIYTIVVDDFKKKLAKATVGEGRKTEEFSVSGSKFLIQLYIAGIDSSVKRHIGLVLYNKSDRKVWIRKEISVKVNKKKKGF